MELILKNEEGVQSISTQELSITVIDTNLTYFQLLPSSLPSMNEGTTNAN